MTYLYVKPLSLILLLISPTLSFPCLFLDERKLPKLVISFMEHSIIVKKAYIISNRDLLIISQQTSRENEHIICNGTMLKYNRISTHHMQWSCAQVQQNQQACLFITFQAAEFCSGTTEIAEMKTLFAMVICIGRGTARKLKIINASLHKRKISYILI